MLARQPSLPFYGLRSQQQSGRGAGNACAPPRIGGYPRERGYEAPWDRKGNGSEDAGFGSQDSGFKLEPNGDGLLVTEEGMRTGNSASRVRPKTTPPYRRGLELYSVAAHSFQREKKTKLLLRIPNKLRTLDN